MYHPSASEAPPAFPQGLGAAVTGTLQRAALKEHAEFTHHVLAIYAGKFGYVDTINFDYTFIWAEDAEDTFYQYRFA